MGLRDKGKGTECRGKKVKRGECQPSEQKSCQVESMLAMQTQWSPVVTQLTIPCAVELLRLVTSDDIMTSLLKKLAISIKIHVLKPLWSLFWSVSKLSTESVGSRRELVANSVRTVDADATQLNC